MRCSIVFAALFVAAVSASEAVEEGRETKAMEDIVKVPFPTHEKKQSTRL